MTDFDYSDRPISEPQHDLFGLAPFVNAISNSVTKMTSPQGVVIAINGAWGSGKSSAVNLLKHRLERENVADLQVVTFNPWWFRGEEALVLAFFRELYAATSQSLGDKARKLLPKIGARLLKAGGVAAPVADMLGASGAGAVASGTMTWLGSLIKDEESVEKLHRELAEALSAQGKRYLVLIDDIDRLSPDEALAMFRLVKSVGRLPNVIYILAFDRHLAERMVAERYPSEGPHYLEKIVQASFELPVPDPVELNKILTANILAITGEPDDAHVVHVMNLVHDVVSREIASPRDLVRYINALSITWPAVDGNVDMGDFLALEAYRLFQPRIYAALRASVSLLTGGGARSGRLTENAKESLDGQLLEGIADKDAYRSGLMRLFPVLQSIWGNVIHSGEQRWRKDRRACAADHFATYFRLAPGDNVMSAQDVCDLLSHAGDRTAIVDLLRNAVLSPLKGGHSRASLILDTLTVYADEIPIAECQALLTAIFEVADELPNDEAGAFSIGNNGLRIHWLLRALLFGRTSLSERSAILSGATHVAGIGWLASLQESAWTDYHPGDGKEPECEDACLLTLDDIGPLRQRTLARIEQAAAAGGLLDHRHLGHLLFVWRTLADDDGVAVSIWTQAQMPNDHAIACFARAFTSVSWSQGMGMGGGSNGDLVAKRSDRAQIGGLEKIIDVETFRQRVEHLWMHAPLEDDDDLAIRRFRTAWVRNRSGED